MIARSRGLTAHRHTVSRHEAQCVGWCCAGDRSCDPQTGDYVAYRGERASCG